LTTYSGVSESSELVLGTFHKHADKRHFCGWLDNNKQGNHVSAENLAKTRRLQGQRAHDFSKRRNQSTRWTHKREDAVAFFMPPE
jgi:hypothetical protein